MKEADTINMRFQCDVDASNFTQTSCGEFCQQCQKEIVDFTQYSLHEIHQYTEKYRTECGAFTSKQVDPNYIAPIAPKKFLRSFAFLSGVLFFVGTSNGYAQNTVDPKKEQSQGASNAPNFTEEEAEKAQQKGTPVSMSKGEAQTMESNETNSESSEETTTEKPKEKKYLYGRYNRYYLSKKFPFVKRELLVRGKFKF